jgi:predicted AlkP superfamily pyrophosphatase or phosphodiesterase
MLFRSIRTILLVALTACAPSARAAKPTTRPVDAIERVVVISVDGLRPDLLARAYTPNIHALMQAGSFTLWARTTAVSVTLPSHVSMLTGVTPARHEIDWNRDLPLAKPIYPKGSTLFDLAHRNGYTTAMIAGKSKFDVLNRPGSIDFSWVSRPASTAKPTTKPAPNSAEDAAVPAEEWPDQTGKAKKETLSDAVVAEHAAMILRDFRPDVTFVHFPHVDNIGHTYGWGTPEQVIAVEDADAAVGAVLRALREAGTAGSTLIILSADHGGAGRTHGPDDARSRHIPWIAAGPGLKRNFDLTRYANLTVDTEDTFATACYFLGLRPSPRIDGKPILQVIDTPELLQATR